MERAHRQGSQARAYESAGFAPTFSSSDDEPMVTLDALSFVFLSVLLRYLTGQKSGGGGEKSGFTLLQRY